MSPSYGAVADAGVVQGDTSFRDSLVFDGIDGLVVEAVTAAFGTVDAAARGRAAGVA
ncbi:hypothetical protein [Streptomyces sp. NPDC001020]